MKNIDEIYRENLELLISESGGVRQLAERIGKSYAQVSQWRNASKDSKSGKPRSMAKESAQHLEKYCEKVVGWMNTDHGNIQITADINSPVKKNNKDIKIQNYEEVIGAMGGGILLKDQPGQITSISVTPEWIEKNVPHHSGKSNLGIVTGFGDSMKGMFNSGDPLLIDTGVKSVEFDGVYFFRVGDEGFIKRLQRIPGEGIRVISKNPDYESWTIKEGMDFEVFARVLIVWNGSLM
ncbi:MAG: S24 family peptidase [Methylophilaceae bacterium]